MIRHPYFNYLQSKMNTREFRTFTKTETYLRMKLELCKYDPELCKSELQKLQEKLLSQNEDAWECAMASAKVHVFELHQEDPEFLQDPERRRELEIAIAERLMIDCGFAPPHWTETALCGECGFVLVPREKKSIKGPCPWCVSWVGQMFQELRKQHREDEEHADGDI